MNFWKAGHTDRFCDGSSVRRLEFLSLILVSIYWPSQAAAQASAQETIRALAFEITEDARTRQDDKSVDLMYPEAVEMSGGRERMKTIIHEGTDEILAAGWKLEPREIGQPSKPLEWCGKLFSVVPQTVSLTRQKVRMTQNGYMLAISLDQGKTWTFLDGAGLTPEVIKSLFPDFPPGLKLPEQQQPKTTTVR